MLSINDKTFITHARNRHSRLVVNHERTVRVLKSSVRSENRVVRLNHRSRHLGSGIDGELELGLLAVVDRQPLHQKSTKTGTGTTTKGVEDKETLKTGTVVGKTTNLLKDTVDKVLANGVVTTGVYKQLVLCLVLTKSIHAQLLAASSLPVIIVSGWKRLR